MAFTKVSPAGLTTTASFTLGDINATGVGTFASLVVSGNVSVAGTITYEDVTNIDSVGLITARSGIHVTGKVGINTTSPNNNLTVGDGVQTSYAPPGGGNYIEIARTSGADAGLLINKNTGQWLVGIDNSDGANAPLRFEYGAAGSAHPGFGSVTPAMMMKHDGNVGIGTDNPQTKLDIRGGEVYYHSGTNNNLGVKLTYSNGNSTGIVDTYGNHELEIRTNNSERARFTSNGLKFPSGLGIDFSAATGSAAGSTSALLDDYEEGTFDPTVSMSVSGSLTLNSSYNSLSYTKIGRLVTISGQIRIDTVSSPSGNIRITNLPFTVRSTTELGRAGGGLFYFDNSAGAGNYYKPVPWAVEESTTWLYIYTQHFDGGLTPGASDEIGFSCTYVAA